MLTKQIALVSLSKRTTPTELAQTAAALQKQATRDLGPVWNIQATVDYFPNINSIPMGYWPIIITDELKEPGAAGFHTDKYHQPYALVQYDATWQLTCSHEMCEMLVDPYGNKLISARSVDKTQGKVNYLVEVCDPCEDASFAYSVNGILMSDFYTPHYFDPQPVAGLRYSYTGAITQPLEIKKNGYISWHDPVSNKWYQATFFGGTAPAIKELPGMKENGSSLRSQTDRLTNNPNNHTAFEEAANLHFDFQTRMLRSGFAKSHDLRMKLATMLSSQLTVESIMAANLAVTFNNGTEADYLNATLTRADNTNETKTVNSSGGTITFQNVSHDDVIEIDGFCLAEAIVTIDCALLDPLPSKFPGGRFFYNLIVK